ncbi:MAG: type I restriction enzyme HsdR N-terminal domain-containing protein [Humidesulfovibrio sp.]|uniref:type I restriction enzyme HsdR N-terminal domain-containing protein n=1 Tax=Humidesulfovibrio sp. TaxID=2910988 RepID=UPI0027F66AF9|nr:type I restriction enzyme HsdR N-terminal domain-containing protein [Humidesulfovibrio sp.]MDQ7835533.1 type I restriction enzyme HsdR N-terminal domain-containing protein [Humidesulfovibrio sp.]
MHEVSLGGMLTDYLSGESIEETTYEEFRQALAKFLVEEKGYPKQSLKAKVPLVFQIDGEDTGRHIDLVAYDEAGRPLLLVIFCAGDVGSFERETVSCARLFPGGPVPVAIASDSIGASILDTATGDCTATGVRAIPTWDAVRAIDAAIEAATGRVPLSEERRRKEERILHAYNGFLYGTCCSESCRVPPKGSAK